ncbi:PBECR2 nuclease fold domain-containing protein [Thioalkalivibrio sp. ALMg9]|uniref:PBECR2 nuclease fold domain-containing protein n=1 Tax=Thioalkalivibrio sp. ALMg9 TaxID=1266912 RepID=UPI000379291D|nr:PBECR2 nuclease fold domain-containing protein [Thioalkalivibrio sp. ALMg9]
MAEYGSLPFNEQIDYLREKAAMPSRAWTDVYGREHDHAFTVAGASRMAIVEDFQRSIQDMIDNGQTIADFRRDFDDIVQRHGWSYRGARGWRTRVIYETNLLQSYHAGREAQMADPELRAQRPYGLYRHGGSEDPREEHLAHDGRVVPLDDPWWDVWSPRNGWGCKCKKYAISAEEAERRGLTVSEQGPAIETETRTVGVNGPNPRTVEVPKGIDPGFEHRPGGDRVRGVSPPRMARPMEQSPTQVVPDRRAADPLPEARDVDLDWLGDEATAEDAVDAFLDEFGTGRGRDPAYYTDALGERLAISDALFDNGRGGLDVGDLQQARSLRAAARAVREPDEIWAALERDGEGAAVLRRRYLTRYQGPQGPAVAVMEWARNGWRARGDLDDAGGDALRRGVRLYRRGEGS